MRRMLSPSALDIHGSLRGNVSELTILTFTPSSCAAQSPRSPWFMPHGLPWFSMAR